MFYTPPDSISLYFNFIYIQWCILSFNFSDLYSPPGPASLHFDFSIVLFPIDFEFAPELPPPISKEMLLSLAVRLHGQVYKYWICYVIGGKQYIRRYGNEGLKDPWWLSFWQAKWKSGCSAWNSLSVDDKLYWRRVGVRKKEPITNFNAFMSAWMRDKIS